MVKTTLTAKQIDDLNYKGAVAEVRKLGHKGTWIATGKTETFRRLIKGEITARQAEEITLGVSGSAPAPSEAIDEAVTRIVEEQTKDIRDQVIENRDFITAQGGKLCDIQDKVDEIEAKISSGGVVVSGGTATSVPDPDIIRRPDFDPIVDRVADIDARQEKASTVLEEIKRMVSDAITSSPAPVTTIAKALAPTAVKIPSSSTMDQVTYALERYASPGKSVKPIIVKGEPGAGKTYQARGHGRTFNHYIEIGVHNSTEAIDLLGYQTPTVPWVDGPMSEAYRKASLGQTVLLVIDEVYRARSSTQTIFLTSLTADEGYYKLRTGRFIEDPTTGVHVSEELLAPVANLAIVATTNVGAQFDIDEGDEATRRRFIHIHVKVDAAKVRTIVDAYVKARSFSLALTNSMVEFWNHTKVLVSDGFLASVPNISTLCEAIQFSSDEAEVPTELHRLGANLWVANTLDGDPEPEQMKRLHEAFTKSFKGFVMPLV